MARFSIFISYSHKDANYLEELCEQLAPFDLDLDLWIDRDIAVGEAWEPKIRAAMRRADAAVLLVSPSFLASTYVCKVEIPFLMEAANAKKLLLAPLFVRPSNAEHRVFPEIVSPETRELGAKITDYQGLNRPSRPVSALRGAERDALWVDCARKLWEQVQEHHARRSRPGGTGSRSAKIVTVELGLGGQGRLERSYSVPGGDATTGRAGTIDVERLKTLRRTRNDLELGERLFQALFGDEQQIARLMPALLGKKTPAAHFGVRVQIFTDSSELRDLPWACCAWRQRFLAEQQWSFELVTHAGRQGEVQLETPCSAVMIGAEAAGSELGLAKHFESFEGVLDRSWDHPPRIDVHWLRTTEELAERRAVAPQLVYVCAHARESERGGVEIALASAEKGTVYVPIDDSLSAILSGKPSIVVLNTFGACPLIRAVAGAEVILHLRHGRPSQQARAWATTFWSQVLDGRSAPADAFHELDAAARRAGAIWTRYASFETRVSDRTPKIDRARMKLDRRVQREAVMTLVRDLIRGPKRKVTCVVAYGSSGNLVEHFAVQMISTIREWASDIARVHRHRVTLPNPGRPLEVGDFDEVLREYLRMQPEQPLYEGFEAKVRRGARASPVHFVIWQFAERGGAPSGPDLGAWLRYSSEYLSAGVMGPSRILSYVAITLGNDRHQRFLRFLDGQSQAAFSLHDHFRLEVLQPLERITPKDLRDFLRDDANSTCPPGIRDEIAPRICHWTGGEFEKTIEIIERAERANLWPELVEMLPEPDSDPRPEDF